MGLGADEHMLSGRTLGDVMERKELLVLHDDANPWVQNVAEHATSALVAHDAQ